MKPGKAIEVIKSNWPPSNYTTLRESLNIAINAIEKIEKINEIIVEASTIHTDGTFSIDIDEAYERIEEITIYGIDGNNCKGVWPNET